MLLFLCMYMHRIQDTYIAWISTAALSLAVFRWRICQLFCKLIFLFFFIFWLSLKVDNFVCNNKGIWSPFSVLNILMLAEKFNFLTRFCIYYLSDNTVFRIIFRCCRRESNNVNSFKCLLFEPAKWWRLFFRLATGTALIPWTDDEPFIFNQYSLNHKINQHFGNVEAYDKTKFFSILYLSSFSHCCVENKYKFGVFALNSVEMPTIASSRLPISVHLNQQIVF